MNIELYSLYLDREATDGAEPQEGREGEDIFGVCSAITACC